MIKIINAEPSWVEDKYVVYFNNDTECSFNIDDNLNISCGIFQLEYVGNFITKMQRKKIPNNIIADYIIKGVFSIKRNYPHAVFSIVYTPKRDLVIQELVKYSNVTVSGWARNPNSGNNINVVTITNERR